MINNPERIDEQCRQAAVATCVGAADRYHLEDDQILAADALMAEIRMLVGWFDEIGVDLECVDREILDLVENELIVSHGHEVGPRLAAHLRNAFALAWAEHSASRLS